jgi:GNAT superfamily N-acetyltransferase
MDEITGALPPVDSSQESLRAKMSRVVVQMNVAIEGLAITTGRPPLSMEAIGASVWNTQKRENAGDFKFWGSLEPGFGSEFSGPTAIVKDLEVPVKGKGVGSQVVDAWEKAISAEGIRYFVATNIKNPDAMRFWENHGYTPTGTVHDNGVSYAMIKQV